MGHSLRLGHQEYNVSLRFGASEVVACIETRPETLADSSAPGDSYAWGPFDLDFAGCIAKCGATKGCHIATWTGKCYLKKSARGQGYAKNGKMTNKTAVKLSKK